MNFNKSILILITGCLLANLVGCMSWKVRQDNDFDVHSAKYGNAKPSDDVEVPKFIASNIKKQPIYPIDTSEQLSGKIGANKVPPTLTDKIVDND